MRELTIQENDIVSGGWGQSEMIKLSRYAGALAGIGLGVLEGIGGTFGATSWAPTTASRVFAGAVIGGPLGWLGGCIIGYVVTESMTGIYDLFFTKE